MDKHGAWISGLAPIYDAKGLVVGILEVDYKVDKFLMALARKRNYLLLTVLGVLLIGILISFLIAYTFTRPIRRLQEASQEIIEGNYDVQLKVRSQDEIGRLTESFNKMAESLAERFHMLKYISPHTKEMIHKLRNKEISEKGERKNVTIFFSDIRGFTAYSEKRFPEEVVSLLNVFLKIQADIIKRFGGTIDKYVGDEVVAIFSGPERDAAAIKAGIEIQRALTELNQKSGQDLNVGIGISNGDVIMGSIGSDDRKDYTIIGSNVNLASRLCSAAKGREILVSSDIYRTMQKQGALPGVEFQGHGEVQLKGFSVNVHVYAVNYENYH
jgi:adenylate cyclase